MWPEVVRHDADAAAKSASGAANEAPRFLSPAQVARLCGVSSMTVYRAIAAGEVPAIRIRGRLIVPVQAIDAMAEAAMAGRTAETGDSAALHGEG